MAHLFHGIHLVASWAQPHTAPATTTAGYNLPPTPMAWPRLDYAAAAATANPTASATIFGPADLEAFAYSPPTPSFVLAPMTTGARHGCAMPLALTTALANAPASAAPRSVQPRQLDRPSHVIHSTRPVTPHSSPREVTPATSVYARATPAVVEYARPKPLLRNNYLADQGFTWVASADSDNAHRYAVYLRSRDTPRTSTRQRPWRPSLQATQTCRNTTLRLAPQRTCSAQASTSSPSRPQSTTSRSALRHTHTPSPHTGPRCTLP